MSDQKCFLISFAIHLSLLLILLLAPRHTFDFSGGGSSGGAIAFPEKFFETDIQQPEEKQEKQKKPKNKPVIAKNNDITDMDKGNKPTEEPTPKNTPTPSPTPKQSPTPKPTETEKPTPTPEPATQKPTATDVPTATTKPTTPPKPTSTSKPTSTPKPAATSTPAPTPTPAEDKVQKELVKILQEKLKQTQPAAKPTPKPKAPVKEAKPVPTPIEIAGKVALDNVSKLEEADKPKTPDSKGKNSKTDPGVINLADLIGVGNGSGPGDGLGGSGNGTGGGIGDGDGPGLTDGEFSQYGKALRIIFLRNWNQPTVRRPEPRKYVTMVTFTIHRDGTISDIEIEESSGWPFMDQTVKEGLLRSSPVPPLPPSYLGSEIRVRFPFGLRELTK